MMETTYTEILQIINTCIQLEISAAKVYYRLAELFALDEILSPVFRKTALEEENHTRQFEFALKMLGNKAKTRVDLDITAVIKGLQFTKSLLEELQADQVNSVSAVKACIYFEEVLLEFHMGRGVTFEEKSLQDLFKAMMKADQEHIETLHKLLQKITGDQ